MAVGLGTVQAGVALPAQAPRDPKTELEVEKLRQEVRKLQLENDNADGYGASLLRWAPLITLGAGAVAILLSIRKEFREQRAQRRSETDVRQKELDHRVGQAKLEQKQREDELKQRQAEVQRRFDELFSQAVANLGSDKESIQLSAVVVLDEPLRVSCRLFGLSLGLLA
ncbi:MAG: hypothetical protein WKF41_06985 [Gaiellaceae bacterium]